MFIVITPRITILCKMKKKKTEKEEEGNSPTKRERQLPRPDVVGIWSVKVGPTWMVGCWAGLPGIRRGTDNQTPFMGRVVFPSTISRLLVGRGRLAFSLLGNIHNISFNLLNCVRNLKI